MKYKIRRLEDRAQYAARRVQGEGGRSGCQSFWDDVYRGEEPLRLILKLCRGARSAEGQDKARHKLLGLPRKNRGYTEASVKGVFHMLNVQEQ